MHLLYKSFYENNVYAKFVEIELLIKKILKIKTFYYEKNRTFRHCCK